MPTFPARTSSAGSDALPRPSRGGFTFVEVLISMLVAAMLAGVVCAVLTQVAGMEQRTAEARQARFHTERLVCRLALGAGDDPDPALALDDLFAPAWRVSMEPGDDERPAAWTRWTLQRTGDPAISYDVWVRSDLAPW